MVQTAMCTRSVAGSWGCIEPGSAVPVVVKWMLRLRSPGELSETFLTPLRGLRGRLSFSGPYVWYVWFGWSAWTCYRYAGCTPAVLVLGGYFFSGLLIAASVVSRVGSDLGYSLSFFCSVGCVPGACTSVGIILGVTSVWHAHLDQRC